MILFQGKKEELKNRHVDEGSAFFPAGFILHWSSISDYLLLTGSCHSSVFQEPSRQNGKCMCKMTLYAGFTILIHFWSTEELTDSDQTEPKWNREIQNTKCTYLLTDLPSNHSFLRIKSLEKPHIPNNEVFVIKMSYFLYIPTKLTASVNSLRYSVSAISTFKILNPSHSFWSPSPNFWVLGQQVDQTNQS